jgi:hypothetical protein
MAANGAADKPGAFARIIDFPRSEFHPPDAPPRAGNRCVFFPKRTGIFICEPES